MAGTPIRIGIAGALGRMGRAVAAVVDAREGLTVAARFDRPDATDAALVSIDAALEASDVIVDFTTSASSAALAERAAALGRPALVIGSTGLTPQALAAVHAAARRVPVVFSGNYSLGVNVLAGLVEQAARRLGPDDWDIEILESHHRRKVDAPSGTALMLGESAARGRNVRLADVAVRARDGITGPRNARDIGFAVLRGGGIVGEHSVMFASDDEIVTFSHSARDRSLFARGAAEAAAWVAGRPAGLYDMMDVLGFRD